jgi:hypothetical protein
MRARLCLLAVLAAGCANGEGTVVVTLGASPPLAGVSTLHGDATVGSTTRSFDVPLKGAPVTIPPARTFAIVVPLSLGTKMTIHLEARDAKGTTLATADGSVTVGAGRRSDLALTLGAAAIAGDMSVVLDGGAADLGGDLGDGGSCPPGGCTLGNGATCGGDGDCTSGHCVDGHCCGVASCGMCNACVGAGGTCSAQPAGAGNGCSGSMTCDGNGNCVTLGSLGSPCSSGGGCANGQCVDGHCCGVASCGACKACTGAGGSCVNQAGGDGNGCTAATNGKYCDGSGNCVTLGALGATCSHAYQCSAGSKCVDGHCCGVASCGTCKACTGSGGTCANQPINMAGNGCPDGAGDNVCDGNGSCKRSVGTGCSTASQCVNGFCFDNYCCNTSCGGQCQACNATPGTCLPVMGKPVLTTNTPRSDCSGAVVGCYGMCNGSNVGSCVYPAGTSCGAPSCNPGSGTTPARITTHTCDTSGACMVPLTQNCGTITNTIATTKCSGNTCAANCSSDSDCISSDYCSTALAPNNMPGTCVAPLPDGSFCGPPLLTSDCMQPGCSQCTSGPCQVNGQCCSSSCQPAMCVGNASHYSSCNGSCKQLQLNCGMGGGCDNSTGLCRCNNDTDCLSQLFCGAQGSCLPQIESGGRCSDSYCMQSGCNVCDSNQPCPVNGICP